ncbi:MAG: hypothetical protein WBO09_13940 [Methylocystis silviterrae]
MFKKILVAIDLTEPEMTKLAIDKAAALARAAAVAATGCRIAQPQQRASMP